MRPTPALHHMPFKAFLREVVGVSMASARTEPKRRKYLLDFVNWWHERLVASDRGVIRFTPTQMLTYDLSGPADWTPEQIIAQKERDGFQYDERSMWASLFNGWAHDAPKRRATQAAIASWTDSARRKRMRRAKKKRINKVTKQEDEFPLPPSFRL
jgi:hypothetical protein